MLFKLKAAAVLAAVMLSGGGVAVATTGHVPEAVKTFAGTAAGGSGNGATVPGSQISPVPAAAPPVAAGPSVPAGAAGSQNVPSGSPPKKVSAATDDAAENEYGANDDAAENEYEASEAAEDDEAVVSTPLSGGDADENSQGVALSPGASQTSPEDNESGGQEAVQQQQEQPAGSSLRSTPAGGQVEPPGSGSGAARERSGQDD